jgi:hypothetical protein
MVCILANCGEDWPCAIIFPRESHRRRSDLHAGKCSPQSPEAYSNTVYGVLMAKSPQHEISVKSRSPKLVSASATNENCRG